MEEINEIKRWLRSFLKTISMHLKTWPQNIESKNAQNE